MAGRSTSGNGEDTSWARPEDAVAEDARPEVVVPEDAAVPEEAVPPAPSGGSPRTPAAESDLVAEPGPAAPPAPPKRLRSLSDDTGPWSIPADANHVADDTIRAAGGVVWTRWGDGRLRILVIHRPRYDDWSLPKGKANPGESDSACAEREVREETGLSCAAGEELPTTTYLDRKGRAKTVRYYGMQPMGGAFAPNDEVDEIRWLGVDEATRLLSYEHDATVVAALISVIGEQS